MPDKTQYDLETLILMLIAMLNPMIAVFMMKGCGKELVICILLTIFMFVFGVSLFLPTYPLTFRFARLFPGWMYAYSLVTDRHKRKRSGQLVVVAVPAQSSGSNVVQMQRTSTAPAPVVQTIEYKPQPAPTPAPTPASPAKATEVVVVTKAPDSPPAAAPAAAK